MRGPLTVSLYSAVAVVALVVPTSRSLAQYNLGTITGRVTDAADAIIPGCDVQIKNLDTAVARTIQANADGLYTEAGLPPGNYQVSATHPGFKQQEITVVLAVSQSLVVDIHMTVGLVTETVTATASGGAVALQKDDHAISQLLDQTQISSLPVEGRNFLGLVTTAPGVQSAATVNLQGSGAYFGTLPNELVVSGQMEGGTSYLQDGVSNINFLTQSANILPDMDAIQSVDIETNGMAAKFDRPAIVNVVTKSGTNSFHGTLYDYLQNDDLDANNWVNDAFGIPKGPHRYNQFGGTIGGPIRRDKLFFFFNYEGQRELDSSPYVGRVPTDAERAGDFSAWLTGVPVSLGTVQKTTIYDPNTYNPIAGTAQPFPGNIIPGDRLSAFALQYQKFYPEPTTCSASPCNVIADTGDNYTTTLRNTNNLDQYLGKVDYTISPKDTLFGDYQYANAPIVQPSYVPNLFGALYIRKSANSVIEENHVFSSALLNTLRIGYNRSNYFYTQLGVGAENWVQQFGIKNLNPTIQQNSPPGVSVSQLGSLGNIFAPQGAIENRFQYADEVNYTHGHHSIDAGGELIRNQFDGNWVLENSGDFSFNGQFTSNYQLTSAYQNGIGIADFMLGLPNTAAGGNGNTTAAFRKWDIVAYVQDNWRVRPNLVVNLGVRYLYDGPPIDKNGHAAVFNLPTDKAIPGSWNPNPKDFAPRVGFALTLDPHTVLRGGFGMFYYTPAYNMLQFLMANPPNFVSVSNTYTFTQPTPVSSLFPPFVPATILQPFAVAKSMPTPYTEQYNLNLERQLTHNILVSLAYVGDQGRHQSNRMNPNQAALSPDPTDITPIQTRRPYPLIGDVLAQYNVGSSNYNGLQAKAQKTFSDGLAFLVSYTWSRTFDISDCDCTEYANYFDPKRDYGPAGFDQPRIISFSYVYALPFGTGKPYLADSNFVERSLVSGWQINGITSFSSGIPFSVDAPDFSDTGAHADYADSTCNGTLPSNRSYFHWFNTSCYTAPLPGTVGDAPKNPLRQQAFRKWDFSLFRNFGLGESRSLQFRAEAFNIFNQHTFILTGPAVTTTDANFGGMGASAAARTMQLALKLIF